MHQKITQQQVLSRLQENDFPHAVLPLQNGITLVLSQYGGRIMGPFLSPEGASLFWSSDAWASADAFRRFLVAGDWNLGGERVWIAPEIQYNVPDRSRFWDTVGVPAQMDPGQHVLDQPQPGRWRLSQDLALQAYNLASGRKELRLERWIAPAEDPLRHLVNYQELVDGVVWAGYEHVVKLTEGKRDDIVSETWNLIQLRPGGVLLIPASPAVQATDYFEPIDEKFQTIHTNCVRLRISGDRRYKVGYKATHVFGRAGYFNRLDDGRACLFVRTYDNNPAALYAEEPPHLPGQQGHSVHVYNDGGGYGGFGELECNGQTIGGPTGRSSSVDRMNFWLYVGPEHRIQQIALHLLGATL